MYHSPQRNLRIPEGTLLELDILQLDRFSEGHFDLEVLSIKVLAKLGPEDLGQSLPEHLEAVSALQMTGIVLYLKKEHLLYH